MIVPMKTISLFMAGEQKNDALKKLRRLGIVHIEITEGKGEHLEQLFQNVTLLENALFAITGQKGKTAEKVSPSAALEAAGDIASLIQQKKIGQERRAALEAELAQCAKFGDFDPRTIGELAEKGVELSVCELSRSEYKKLDDSVKTLKVNESKSGVLFLLLESGNESDGALSRCKLELPRRSTAEIRNELADLQTQLQAIDESIHAYAGYGESMTAAIEFYRQEIEFETYATGMGKEDLSASEGTAFSIAYFKGYVEAEKVELLRQTAKENSWGLTVADPTPEDNVPTKVKNNKLVSLIYPITDFLGTVPGYFEYDVSGWFLSFLLIFFGIIFGDGGYGLVVSAAAAVLIAKPLLAKKEIPPAFLLVGLFGLSTMLWGLLTCTWFGLPAEVLPLWLQRLSIPVLSNVYADKLWHPFWTSGDVGLTTTQNVQIFCFTLALVQLSVAHLIGAARNRKSLKILGDIGAVFQLLGMYYIVLSLVVNPDVFSFGLVISGIPVGTVAIALIGVGFVLNFVFANYEGSIGKSILASLTNVVSVLLGVVNVFSDIVSYIRLWAVGLAGAAISATVNDLAGPFLGNFMFMIIAIVLLVFGHGLNMILNVLSVIVHGIRLNTLEFSSHLDMSWSGHKFKPFKEQIDHKGETL